MSAAELRGVACWGIIGFNRTGKSTLARLIAEAWKASRPGQDIMAFDPQKAFTGIANKFLNEYDGDWLDQALKLRNGLLILDELRMLHPAHVADRRLLKLLAMRAENKVDIIYIVHSPKLILEVMDSYTSDYMIFYTQAKASSWKDKIANYENCVAASNVIKRYTTKYGLGDWPNFPYMHVDNGAGKISAVNVDPEKFNTIVKG